MNGLITMSMQKEKTRRHNKERLKGLFEDEAELGSDNEENDMGNVK